MLLLAACGRLGFGTDGTDGTTDSPIDAPGQVDAAPGSPDAARVAHNLAFVSSMTYLPDVGGAQAADVACRGLAIEAGLSGTFVALLADSSRGALDALAGSRGWTDVAGTPIADLPTDWVDGRMVNPLRLDEAGQPAPGDSWIGDASNHCLDWTSAQFVDIGRHAPSAQVVQQGAGASCNQANAFICVELGDATPLDVPVETGRIAFVTANVWPGGSGIAGADAQCAADAASAGLPGSYLAWLGTSTTPGFDRFDTAGAPWRRVDGVRLTATAAEFAAQTPGGQLRTFLNRTAAGDAVTGTGVHTGAAGATCADWTDVSGATSNTTGYAVSADVDEFWNNTALPCNFALRLVCLQE